MRRVFAVVMSNSDWSIERRRSNPHCRLWPVDTYTTIGSFVPSKLILGADGARRCVMAAAIVMSVAHSGSDSTEQVCGKAEQFIPEPGSLGGETGSE